MKNDINILMTASVSTHSMKGAFFSDQTREKMYLDAISYYCHLFEKQEIKPNIIFVDNSDWDLSFIKSKIKYPNIEFISLPASQFDNSKGKGYNEFLLIDKAIEISNYLKQAKGFIKVTGRYPILNINTYTKDIKSTDLIYCDLKDHSIYDRLGLNWCGHSCDTRIFYINKKMYIDNLKGQYHRCNDYEGYLAELLMYNYVKTLDRKNSNIRLRFRREPEFGGVEGSPVTSLMCSNDHSSIKFKIITLIGNSIRIFMPWLYI